VSVALVRGRIEVCGPIGEPALAALVGLSGPRVAQALARLEGDGQVLRGTFRMAPDGTPAAEWCDRRLLQRIHRLTVGRLRREVEPLSSQDFMRFLFRWHHLEEGDRLRAGSGLLRAISLLQGIEAPAAAWEQALLPARMAGYTPDLLEQLCWHGEVVWGRLTLRQTKPVPGPARNRVVPSGGSGVTSGVPLQGALAGAGSSATEQDTLIGARSTAAEEGTLAGARSTAVAQGALAADTSVAPGRGSAAGAAPTATGVASGSPQQGADVREQPGPTASVRPLLTRAASITFALRKDVDVWLAAARPGALEAADTLPEGLSHAARDVARVLTQRGACFFTELVSRSKRLPSEVEDALWELLAHGVITADAVQNLRVLQSPARRKRQKVLNRGGPGRWSLLQPIEEHAPSEVLEQLVRLFLQRWGILLRELVAREPLAPSWRELLPVLRRMEARGELRGGRFVASVAGEQYALPEAVDLARTVRRQPPKGERVQLAAVDPLNLTGVLLPGPRIAAQLGHWVTFVDGVPQGVEEREVEEDESDAA
jgi:hypothetical protein